MRIAISPPWFAPPAAYYRLFHEVDFFVVCDDWSFPVKGRVHRTLMESRNNGLCWLTLPLLRDDSTILIKNISFADNAADRWSRHRKTFPVFDKRPLSSILQTVVLGTSFKEPLDFVVRVLELTCEQLGLDCSLVKSSRYKWSQFKHGQDLVIEMCKRFKATEYVCLEDYDPAAFAAAGIELKMLKAYEGNGHSLIERLGFEETGALKEEIIRNVKFVD